MASDPRATFRDSIPARPHHAVWPQRLPHELAVPETTLYANLEISARRYPKKAATVFFGQSLSYAALQSQAEAIAGWLQSVGVEKGDRVLLFMQNCPQFMAAFFGILRADAVVVPVNPMNKAPEFEHYILDAQPKVTITTADLAIVVAEANAGVDPLSRLTQVLVTRFTDALPEGPIDPELAPAPAVESWLRLDPPLPRVEGTQFVPWAEVLAEGIVPGPATAEPDDMALLPYTSGTTGHPKGCIHTHRTIMSSAVATSWSHGGPEAVGLGVVPMFHITGMVAMNGGVYAGSTTVMLPRWDRELAGRLISKYRISHWTCIPTMIIDLFGSPNYARFDLSSLRVLNGGGAAMPAAVAQRLKDEFGLTFGEGYGLTETAAASHANPPERAKAQCLGMPIFGVDSLVVDPETLKEVPIGETGEIVTSAPALFLGYWNHREATEKAFVQIDGRRYFRTGDLGRMDEEGYFFITDRLKRMINASGFKVWPSEVEALLYRHPAVQEACIIATQDAYRGESVKALIVLRAGARESTTEAELIEWSRGQMAAYKVPRQVKFVESLPKSGSGKVMWRQLQDEENAAATAQKAIAA